MGELEASWKLLDVLPTVDPSGNFIDRTVDSLRRARSRERLRSGLRRTAVAAAAAVVIAAAFFVFGTHDEPAHNAELIENLTLMEDLDLLEEFSDDLDLVMEYELYIALGGGEEAAQ